jgi:hypothetical protein
MVTRVRKIGGNVAPVFIDSSRPTFVVEACRTTGASVQRSAEGRGSLASRCARSACTRLSSG